MNKSVPKTPRVLMINSSARTEGSVTRELTAQLVARLQSMHGAVEVTHRDLAMGIGLVNHNWITANFTDESERDDAQRSELAQSDLLVQELQDADILVLGVPVYNFGVPAALKAWIDMVARARKTFRYTTNGPEGLLRGKKAYLIVASGGVPVDSPMDFATPYMRHALKFIGINDVEVIAAAQINSLGVTAVDKAREKISRVEYRESTGRRAPAITALAS
jgi:FMN-dependent NADH-azoreductase